MELGNYSAIDYTINWLVENDVEEIFMFYSNLKQQVEEYHQLMSKSVEAKLHLHYMKPTELKRYRVLNMQFWRCFERSSFQRFDVWGFLGHVCW